MAAREATKRRREVAAWRHEVTVTSSSPTSSSRTASTISAAGFSPIPPAPIRVGEGEAPSSWDPVPTPKEMESVVDRKCLKFGELA